MKYLTRKDIADIVESTVMHVCRNEEKLGLLPHKVERTRAKSPVKYRKKGAEEALQKKGYVI